MSEKHVPSMQTAKDCFLDGAAGEFLPEDWDAFIAQVRAETMSFSFPIEPTDEMIDQARDSMSIVTGQTHTRGAIRKILAAALKASPKNASQTSENAEFLTRQERTDLIAEVESAKIRASIAMSRAKRAEAERDEAQQLLSLCNTFFNRINDGLSELLNVASNKPLHREGDDHESF